MALSTEDAAWLTALRAARQKLILGQQVASVASGGRSISLAALDPAKALTTIDDEIARLEHLDLYGALPVRRGALRFRY